MPLLFIHVRDSGYCARDNGTEYDTPQAALALGLRSAMALAVDEIGQGGRTAAVEVTVEQEDGTRLLSSVVAISVSPMMVAEQGVSEQVFADDGERT